MFRELVHRERTALGVVAEFGRRQQPSAIVHLPDFTESAYQGLPLFADRVVIYRIGELAIPQGLGPTGSSTQ